MSDRAKNIFKDLIFKAVLESRRRKITGTKLLKIVGEKHQQTKLFKKVFNNAISREKLGF